MDVNDVLDVLLDHPRADCEKGIRDLQAEIVDNQIVDRSLKQNRQLKEQEITIRVLD